MVELGGYDELCGKGSPLTLFLFSDVLEISKRRQRAGRMRGPGGLGLRSPSTLSLRDSALMNTPGTPGTFRSLKHVDLMRLSAIRRVVDIIDGNEHRDCFTIVYRTNQVNLALYVVDLMALFVLLTTTQLVMSVSLHGLTGTSYDRLTSHSYSF